MKRILVVEDDNLYFSIIEGDLSTEAITIIRAETLLDADDFFEKNRDDLDLIVMDACVPGDEPNSMWLVRKIISSGYKKPIIACSSSSEYRETLMRAGATHQTNKFQAVKKIKSLLDL